LTIKYIKLQRGAFPIAFGAIWLGKVNYKVVVGILILLGVVNSSQKKKKISEFPG
jgi:hypothetical protein